MAMLRNTINSSAAIDAACTNLLINDYKTPKLNLVKGKSGDDSTMFAMVPNADSQTVSLTSKDESSYYYEGGFCPDVDQLKFNSLEMVITTFAPNTYFAVNFQTSDKCDGVIKNNYLMPFANNAMNITAGTETKISIDIPLEVTGKLIAISIEDLQPFRVATNFGAITLICGSAVTKSIALSAIVLLHLLL
jgi:hypothetical protein